MVGLGGRQTENRERFLFLTSIIDYLKTNEYRIATHSSSRTDGPLASRSDLSKYVSLVRNGNIDILAMDTNKNITLITCIMNEEFSAHYLIDPNYIDSMKAIINTGGNNLHYIIITNGVIMPDMVMSNPFGSGETKNDLFKDLGVDESKFTEIFGKIEFIETRFDAKKVHNYTDHKMYLRKVIGKTRTLIPAFSDTETKCEGCEDRYFEGNYTINYLGKMCKCKYWICPSCGIQAESNDTNDRISNFMQGLV